MCKKFQGTFQKEIKDSVVFWGEYSNEGEDYYSDFILPMNVGDTVTRDDNTYKVTSKDWDYDNSVVYFTFTKLNE